MNTITINTHWVYKNIVEEEQKSKFSHLSSKERKFVYALLIKTLFEDLKELLRNEPDPHFTSFNSGARNFEAHTTYLHWRTIVSDVPIEIVETHEKYYGNWLPKLILIKTVNSRLTELLDLLVQKNPLGVLLQKTGIETSSELFQNGIPKTVRSVFQ